VTPINEKRSITAIHQAQPAENYSPTGQNRPKAAIF
jgi:hypothetical protein